MLRHHYPSAPQHSTGCISLLVIEAYTPCWILLSKTLLQRSKDNFIDFHNFQWQAQYQGWMLTFSGSAHPLCDNILQPCPGHRRKIGLTSRLYTRASRVLDRPPKRKYLDPGQMRFPRSSTETLSTTCCMTISTCSEWCNMQPHLPWIIKRHPLPSY